MGTFEVRSNTFCVVIWPQTCGDQGGECGSGVLYRLLNTWSQAGGTVEEVQEVWPCLHKYVTGDGP